MIQVGSRIDRYIVEATLGQGGMAVVYRVRHAQLGTEHALKLLHPTASNVGARLLLEGRIQGALVHPNVVAVTDVVEHDGALGLVMELVRGPPLDRLLSDRSLTLEQVDSLVDGILTGVAWAHARGLVHRDLKPGNILLLATGDGFIPKIADFGLAKVLGGDSHTRSGTGMGTPAYMAPEQIRSAKHVDARADVFSLGAILYELVTDRRAFDGDDTFAILDAIGKGRYAPLSDVVPNLPDRMVRAITGALTVDADARIADVPTLHALWRGDATPAAKGPWGSDVMANYTESVDHALGSLRLTAPGEPHGGTADTVDFTDDPPPASSPPPLEPPATVEAPLPPPAGRPWPPLVAWGALAAGVVALGAFAALSLGPPPSTTPSAAPPPSEPVITAAPAEPPPPEPEPPAAAPIAPPVSRPPTATASADAPPPPPAAAVPAEPAPVAVVAAPIVAPKPMFPVTFGVKGSPSAEVYLDGARIGATPLVKFLVPEGVHEVELRRGDANLARPVTVGPDAPVRYLWDGADQFSAFF